MSPRPVSRSVGVSLGIASSTSFSASGTFAKALTDAGFSPLQAVWMRILGACALLVAVTLVLRGPAAFARMWRDRTVGGAVVMFGLVVVASCQGLYFVAASRLPVGIAILLEFTGPVLVVCYLRLIRRQHVRRTAFLGIGLAMVGLCCVVQIWTGMQLDAVGLACGLGSAAGNATYFVLLDKVAGTVDPLTLTSGGMVVGAVALAPLATPWHTPWHLLEAPVAIGGNRVPGWLVVALLVLLWPRVITWLLSLLVAGSAAVAVTLYTYVDVGQLGPLPNLYENTWHVAGKVPSAVAEAAAALISLLGLAMAVRARRRR